MDYWIIPGLPHNATYDSIVNAVSEVCGISVDGMKKKTRKREVVEARYLCYKLLNELTTLSLSGIGDRMGGFDHATVKHGISTIENLIDTNKLVKKTYLNIKRKLDV